MKLKLEFVVPEEQEMVAQYYHAPIAWSAIDSIYQIIRSHDKHGARTKDEVVQLVWTIVCEARSKTE